MTTNVIKLNVWGREVELKIVFDVYEGEEILENQNKALDMFLAQRGLLNDYSKIKEYIENVDGDELQEEITNIYKYVIPNSIFVKRNENNRTVALLCDYRFDEEGGIAVLYENEPLVKIGTQDII